MENAFILLVVFAACSGEQLTPHAISSSTAAGTFAQFLLALNPRESHVQIFGHGSNTNSFSTLRSKETVFHRSAIVAMSAPSVPDFLRDVDGSNNFRGAIDDDVSWPGLGAIIRYGNRDLLPSRRTALLAGVGGSATLALKMSPAFAEDTPTLAASWIASQGFSEKSKNFIEFDESAYKAMLDDEKRTSTFVKAIQKRLAQAPPGSLTVLDLGCGPDAPFALAAARAGAKKVYAIEGNYKAAKKAFRAIANAEAENDIPTGVVELFIGLSEKIDLPEKVDFLVAEITGSVSSEEGAYASFRDAHARFVKEPSNPNSYIPYALQTYGAPATYALHYALKPPSFDWSKQKDPVRLNCRDKTLGILADPLLLEEIRPASELPTSGIVSSPDRLEWRLDSNRISANEQVYYEELLKENANDEDSALTDADARALARNVSLSMSGIALWQKMVLDAEGTLIVDSRGPNGEPQKSHWQTVLPILSTRPVDIKPGDVVRARFDVDLKDGKYGSIGTPLQYSLTASLAPS